MTTSTRALRPTDREDIAQRLLRSSAKASYDPLTEIDWDTPVNADLYALPPHRLSLYGTPLWDQLSEAQRKELSRQEAASTASVGIWFETILMQMLIRHAYDRDPTTSHVQYSYTEIGDECRHSVMFARFIGAMGAPHYRLDPVSRFLGRIFKTTSNGPLTFGAALFVEELLDQMQREMMADDQIEPLARAVARLHVTEEARHMRYAREELIRDWPRRGALTRAYSRLQPGPGGRARGQRAGQPGVLRTRRPRPEAGPPRRAQQPALAGHEDLVRPAGRRDLHRRRDAVRPGPVHLAHSGPDRAH